LPSFQKWMDDVIKAIEIRSGSWKKKKTQKRKGIKEKENNG
jgi:hypothetical protein